MVSSSRDADHLTALRPTQNSANTVSRCGRPTDPRKSESKLAAKTKTRAKTGRPREVYVSANQSDKLAAIAVVPKIVRLAVQCVDRGTGV